MKFTVFNVITKIASLTALSAFSFTRIVLRLPSLHYCRWGKGKLEAGLL